MTTRTKLKDRTDGSEVPFRVTRRKGRGNMTPSIRIKCGCCKEAIVIHLFDDILEIEGVYGSVDQWREVLLPILGLSMADCVQAK